LSSAVSESIITQHDRYSPADRPDLESLIYLGRRERE
jgi:hypothetical protein